MFTFSKLYWKIRRRKAESIKENPQIKRRGIREIFMKIIIYKYRKGIKTKYI
jgi:hypothetical protein